MSTWLISIVQQPVNSLTVKRLMLEQIIQFNASGHSAPTFPSLWVLPRYLMPFALCLFQ